MRSEQCEKCEHYRAEIGAVAAICSRSGKPVSKIRGCALCPSGRKFFKARSGKEAIRLRISNTQDRKK